MEERRAQTGYGRATLGDHRCRWHRSPGCARRTHCAQRRKSPLSAEPRAVVLCNPSKGDRRRPSTRLRPGLDNEDRTDACSKDGALVTVTADDLRARGQWAKLTLRSCGCRRRPPSLRSVAHQAFVTAFWSGVDVVNGLSRADPVVIRWVNECISCKVPCCTAAEQSTVHESPERPFR